MKRYYNYFFDITKNGFEKNLDFIYRVGKLKRSEIDKMIFDNKKGLDKAVLFIYISKYYQNNKTVKYFYDIYMEYIKERVKDYPEEYCNNIFCQYLLFENKDENWCERKVLGRTVSDILELLNERAIEIFNKLDCELDISDKEKFFVENLLLMCTNNLSLKASSLYEYFEYFEINKLNSGRKIQLYKLFLVTKKLHEIELDESTLIFIKPLEFFESEAYSSSFDLGKELLLINLGKEPREYLKCLKIGDLFNLIYSVYHEVGHINEYGNSDEYSKEMQELFEMERFVFSNSRDFYLKYYDYSFLEKAANDFAFEEINKDFKDNKKIIKLNEFFKKKFGIDEEKLDDYKRKLYSEFYRIKSLDKKSKK